MFPFPLSRAATATVVLLLSVISLTTFSACTAQPTEHRAGPRNTIPVRDQPKSVAPPQRQSAAPEPRDERRCRRVERPKHAPRVCGT